MPNQQTEQQNQVPDLLIKSNEVIQLNQLLEQVPTKWGYGLVNFFRAVGQQRQQEAAIANDSGKSLSPDMPSGVKVSDPTPTQESLKEADEQYSKDLSIKGE